MIVLPNKNVQIMRTQAVNVVITSNYDFLLLLLSRHDLLI